MDDWKQSFAEKLNRVQSRWASRLDEALDAAVRPVFDDLADFLSASGFTATMPMQDEGRRSFKFELAEDAYLLMIFRSKALGEFELSREWFVLGGQPSVRRSTERLTSLSAEWAREEFQDALDSFAEALSDATAAAEPELAVV